MRFDAVADCQIVRIVDFQILLVAVDGQNMVVADGVNLSLTRLVLLYSSFSATSRMRCFVSSFTFRVGSSFKTRETVASETPASVAISFSVAIVFLI